MHPETTPFPFSSLSTLAGWLAIVIREQLDTGSRTPLPPPPPIPSSCRNVELRIFNYWRQVPDKDSMRGVLRSARTNCAVDPLAPLALALALAQTLLVVSGLFLQGLVIRNHLPTNSGATYIRALLVIHRR